MQNVSKGQEIYKLGRTQEKLSNEMKYYGNKRLNMKRGAHCDLFVQIDEFVMNFQQPQHLQMYLVTSAGLDQSL